MALELFILGSNSAAFAHNRHHTSQLLRIQDKHFLIDCGEGTQLLLKKNKIKLSRINQIFISHLHGDHYYGLMGLLSTLHLYGKKTDLRIFGPPGLIDIISLQLKYSSTYLCYDVKFKEWTPDQAEIIYEDHKLTIETIPLSHRIPCSGYLFREKPKKRGLNKKFLPDPLPPNEILELKEGRDVYGPDGSVKYRCEEVTFPPKKHLSYAYCSDTKYMPGLAQKLKEVDLIYHEATFMEDMKTRAEATFHSTAAEAAQVAKDANAGMLLLGHFSTRYRDLKPMLNEARKVFPATELAEEGKKFVISL